MADERAALQGVRPGNQGPSALAAPPLPAHDESMRDHIITAHDGSPLSAAAARWAADEALRRGIGLTVVACYSARTTTHLGVSSAPSLSAVPLRVRDEAWSRVDKLAGELAEVRPGLVANACVVEGRAQRELVELAERADLLVVGSTGSGRPAGSSIGSVTRAVLQGSPCPVVLVPGEHTMREVPQVTAAVDGTERSAAALEWAVDETDLLGGELTVVHAFSCSAIGRDTDQVSNEASHLMRIEASLVLEEAVDRARTRGSSKVEGQLAEGRAATEVVRCARVADLLVVGTRRRSPRLHLSMVGSVAEAVVRHAPCPVVVVRERCRS